MLILAPQALVLPDGPGLQFLPFFVLYPKFLPICLCLIAWKCTLWTKPPVSNRTTLCGVPPCMSSSCVAKTANLPCPMPSQFQLHTLSAVWSLSWLCPDCHRMLPDRVLEPTPCTVIVSALSVSCLATSNPTGGNTQLTSPPACCSGTPPS